MLLVPHPQKKYEILLAEKSMMHGGRTVHPTLIRSELQQSLPVNQGANSTTPHGINNVEYKRKQKVLYIKQNHLSSSSHEKYRSILWRIHVLFFVRVPLWNANLSREKPSDRCIITVSMSMPS